MSDKVCVECCNGDGRLVKGLCMTCYNKQYYAKNADESHARNKRYRAEHKDAIRERMGYLPMSENKACASYLGIHVAERLLANVFTGTIEVMPFGNPGFDFVCGKGFKVDAKSATLNDTTKWSFNIRKNKIADYFACLSFDNREDLNLQHFHLIPGCVVNHLNGFTFRVGTVSKWRQYEKPINELLSCCDTMKGGI